MGGSQSAPGRVTIEQIEEDSFNVVHVSEDLINKLRGLPPKEARVTDLRGTPYQVQLLGGEGGGMSAEDKEQLRKMQEEQMFALRQLERTLQNEKLVNTRLNSDLEKNHRELRSLRQQLNELGKNRDAFQAASLSPGAGPDDKKHAKELEESYRQKLAEFNAKQAAMLAEAATKFNQAVKDVEAKFVKTSHESACGELESELLSCYLAHPKTTLLCSTIAKQYIQCVNEYRAEMLNKSA